MKTPSKKDLPARDFFLVRKGHTKIQRVKVVEATPRYVVLRTHFGTHMRERRSSMYHFYHESFAHAKAWLLVELRTIYDKANESVVLAGARWDEVNVLDELDIP